MHFAQHFLRLMKTYNKPQVDLKLLTKATPRGNIKPLTLNPVARPTVFCHHMVHTPMSDCIHVCVNRLNYVWHKINVLKYRNYQLSCLIYLLIYIIHSCLTCVLVFLTAPWRQHYAHLLVQMYPATQTSDIISVQHTKILVHRVNLVEEEW